MGAYDRFQQDGSWSSQGDCPHLSVCLTGLATDERSQLLSAAFSLLTASPQPLICCLTVLLWLLNLLG